MEATTPFRVDVVAKCPNCGERTAMAVEVSSVLEVGDEDSFLKLKSKSKKVDHLCGQVPLPLVADGQRSLEEIADDLRDIGVTSVEKDDDGTVRITADADKARPRSRTTKDES